MDEGITVNDGMNTEADSLLFSVFIATFSDEHMNTFTLDDRWRVRHLIMNSVHLSMFQVSPSYRVRT